MEGHAAQSMFFTERVIVLSAAIAAGDATTTATKAAWATSLFMLALRSRGKKEGSDEVEAERGGDEDRCQDEGCLDDAIWQGPRTRFPLGAAAAPRSVNQPIARSQEQECRRDEVGLIRRKPREVADPCAADAQGEQHKRQDAARRCCERAPSMPLAAMSSCRRCIRASSASSLIVMRRRCIL